MRTAWENVIWQLKELIKKGFVVMPIMSIADPVLCKAIGRNGGQCVMPLGSPIVS